MAGLAMLAAASRLDEGGVFDFNQLFELDHIQIPPHNLEASMPSGWTVATLDPYFQQIKEATEAGRPFDSVQPPEGLTAQELFEAWNKLLLFIDSGAVLRQNTEHNIATARLQISERGLSDILVVLDQDYRVISGLPYVWALAEMDGYDTVPAAILHDAAPDAGWEHTHAEALKWGQTLWQKGEVQSVLESATEAEREFFQAFGFHQVPDSTVLTCSKRTFQRLGALVEKELGRISDDSLKIKRDPAQLLFIEALREAVLEARRRIISEGKGKPGDPEKLKLHLKEEAAMERRGASLVAKKNLRWQVDGDGLFSHPALPRYRFKLVDSHRMVNEVSSEPTASAGSHVMSLSQFQLLARDHFGLDAEEAAMVYESESADTFNSRLRRYVRVVEPIERRGPYGPSDEERVGQAQRLALWNSR